MRILITGGCGFVGFNLAAHFMKLGHSVIVADNLARRGSETNLAALRKLGAPFHHCDIRCPEDVAVLPDADCLVECSAQPSVVSGYERPLYDIQSNLMGAVNCLELCRTRRMAMIFLSSSRVYSADLLNNLPRIETETRWNWLPMPPDIIVSGFDAHLGISAEFSLAGAPKTIYGASKVAADLLCQEYAHAFDLPIVVNRLGVIAGEGQFGVVNQGWLTYWAMAAVFKRPLTYFGHLGKQVRDILFIEDLCRLLETQINHIDTWAGAVWNAGGGRESSLSLLEATALFERLTGRTLATTYAPRTRRGDVVIYITDNSAVSRDLAWRPTQPLETGAQRILHWVTDNQDALTRAGL